MIIPPPGRRLGLGAQRGKTRQDRPMMIAIALGTFELRRHAPAPNDDGDTVNFAAGPGNRAIGNTQVMHDEGGHVSRPMQAWFCPGRRLTWNIRERDLHHGADRGENRVLAKRPAVRPTV